MTPEILTTKVFVAWAAVPITTFAVADATAQTAIINLIGLAISSITAIGLAWIAYKQITHIRKQDELAVTVKQLEKNTNGLNEKLNAATANENLAIGREEGKAAAEAKANVIAAAKAEGVAQEKAGRKTL